MAKTYFSVTLQSVPAHFVSKASSVDESVGMSDADDTHPCADGTVVSHMVCPAK